MAAIRRYARQVVEKFQPEKVILFGSFARGDQREGSDVDLLVVMPARNEISKASRISYELEAPFALDLIVRTPKHMQRGLDDKDWFLKEVLETGKVLYAASNPPLGKVRIHRTCDRAPDYCGNSARDGGIADRTARDRRALRC